MELKVIDLGQVSYQYALHKQKLLWYEIKEREYLANILVCQHFPVITQGKSSRRENILVGPKELAERNIEVYSVDRGGDVTYHGPGQLVFYPIFNLKYFKRDINLFLRNLEEVVIGYLGKLSIVAKRLTGSTGVWVNNKKIASLGIAVRQWVTYHGLSINIKHACLDNFKLIRPCGMDIKVTCLEDILGLEIDIDKEKTKIIGEFKNVFNIKRRF